MMTSSSIPLQCNICPKKPRFSDVSHLLTHIASKGHLSHYYKVKVRSGTEEASRRLIDAYDQWYTRWKVEDLMSERMSQKEKKRTRVKSASTPSKSSQIAAAQSLSTKPARSRNLYKLDPRLTERSVKTETQPTPPPCFDYSHLRLGFASPVQLWSYLPPNPYDQVNGNFGDDIGYYDPFCRNLPSPFEQCFPHETHEEPNDDLEAAECTKLKGVYWPGMDIFDSATPEMRRKRNQKKDISVVEQLELNSLEVEPTEMIFTPLGSFKKQRRISGSIHDSSSPVKLDVGNSRPTRSILGNLDPNRHRRGRGSCLVRQENAGTSNREHHDFLAEELQNYTDPPPRKRRDLEVFQDQEISLSNPASFNYLTSEFHYLPSTQPPQFDLQTCLTTTGLSYGKENTELVAYYTPADNTGMLPFPPLQPNYGPDPQPFLPNTFLFSSYNTQEDLDDQRTVTAPPSENQDCV